MFRALYDYRTDLKQYLSFQTGDQFTVLESSQKDWFLAQNGFGEIGYIPKNYVVKDQVSESEVLKSIDRAIEVIHYEASSKGGQYTHTQRENLKKLIEHRENVRQTYRTVQDASDWVVVSSESVQAGTSTADIQPKRRTARRTAPAPPVNNSEEVTPSKEQQPVRTSGELTIAQSEGQPSVTTPIENTHHQPLLSDDTNKGRSAVLENGPKYETETQKLSISAIDIATMTKGIELSDCATMTEGIKTSDCATKTYHIQMSHNTTSPTPSPTKLSSSKCEEKLLDCRTIPVPCDLASDLVEEIRRNTGLSYKKSCVAVETVLGHLGLRIPDISELMDRIHDTIQESDMDNADEETSCDYERLCDLFAELTECKDDSQQRGWHLHEDEIIINQQLEEMLSILENAKQSISKKALARESYEGVYNLVQYYQMENRLRLKLVLLRVFGAMCSLDSAVISLLLFSVLATELAEELQQNIDELQRSSYVSLLLCMIFCTGEPVPANLHDYLNTEFIDFVFTTLENPPTDEHKDQVTELLVNFILAFNLHFLVPKENLVMKVIEEKQTVKVFTENVLLLFNRDDDPVKMFDHEPHPPNSIMKLLQDMYSSPTTANIFYTNDARVLIDIILRHLIDLPPGDKERSAHLKLMQLYLQNADYVEHKHRYAELSECLHRIQVEEEYTGDDKHIVTYIFTQLDMFND